MSELIHYGVLGMKWGVRHDYPPGSGHYPDGNISSGSKKAESHEYSNKSKKAESREYSNKSKKASRSLAYGSDNRNKTFGSSQSKGPRGSVSDESYKWIKSLDHDTAVTADKVEKDFEAANKVFDLVKDYKKDIYERMADGNPDKYEDLLDSDDPDDYREAEKDWYEGFKKYLGDDIVPFALDYGVPQLKKEVANYNKALSEDSSENPFSSFYMEPIRISPIHMSDEIESIKTDILDRLEAYSNSNDYISKIMNKDYDNVYVDDIDLDLEDVADTFEQIFFLRV